MFLQLEQSLSRSRTSTDLQKIPSFKPQIDHSWDLSIWKHFSMPFPRSLFGLYIVSIQSSNPNYFNSLNDKQFCHGTFQVEECFCFLAKLSPHRENWVWPSFRRISKIVECSQMFQNRKFISTDLPISADKFWFVKDSSVQSISFKNHSRNKKNVYKSVFWIISISNQFWDDLLAVICLTYIMLYITTTLSFRSFVK